MIYLKIIAVAIIFSISLNVAAENIPIKNESTGFVFKPIQPSDIKQENLNYFISGGISNPYGEINGLEIKNLQVTDSACFVRFIGRPTYFFATPQRISLDIRENCPFLSFDTLSKTNDDDILSSYKTMNRDKKEAIHNKISSMIKINRGSIEYNNKEYNLSGSTRLSYSVSIQTNDFVPPDPTCACGCMLYAVALPFLCVWHNEISEIIYIETYRPNFIVTKLELLKGMQKYDNFDDIKWEFKKTSMMNYLIVHIKMESSPMGGLTEGRLTFEIGGTFSKSAESIK